MTLRAEFRNTKSASLMCPETVQSLTTLTLEGIQASLSMAYNFSMAKPIMLLSKEQTTLDYPQTEQRIEY